MQARSPPSATAPRSGSSAPPTRRGASRASGAPAPAPRRGGEPSVWVDETRPVLQGARLTAWELGRLGIPFRLVVDALAGSLMAAREVDAVIVGADRIAANGDVANKVGTYSLAVLAAHHDIPFYVAAPVSTLDSATPTGADIPVERRDAHEVTDLGDTRIAPPGAAAENRTF